MTEFDQDVVQVQRSNTGDSRTSLMLGASASLQTVFDEPACPPLLLQSLSGSLSWHSRNENDIARVVQSPNQAPLFMAALMALGARAVFANEEGSLADTLRRTLFLDDPLLAIRVPLKIPNRSWGIATVSRTPADTPIVAAIAVVDTVDEVVREANLALTGVWREYARLAEAVKMLEGAELTDEHIQQIAEAVEEEIEPRDSYRGSAKYKRAMASVLTRRALEDCRKGNIE